MAATSNHPIRCCLAVCFGLLALHARAQQPSWICQLGSAADDATWGLAADGTGGLFACGTTEGGLGWSSSGQDGWLARYDEHGAQLWMRAFHTSYSDTAWGVTSDGSGGAYVAGTTGGNLAGPNPLFFDAWLGRYDSAGNQLWIRQIGGGGYTDAWMLALDGAGGLFVAGSTDSGSIGSVSIPGLYWLARYDGVGHKLWIRPLATAGTEMVFAATSDGVDGIYFVGETSGSFGGPNAGQTDAWIARYDHAGMLLWARQFGTNALDEAWGVASDGAGGVLVSGVTSGSLGGPNAGFGDVWLARLDGAGATIWLRQFGTTAGEGASSASADGVGGMYLSGVTGGNFGGLNAGGPDAWLAHHDSAGNQLWVQQLGTSADDRATALASDGIGSAYVGGHTLGGLGGPSAGLTDAWLARYGECAGVTYCTSGTTSIACTPSISSSGTPSSSAASGFTITVSGTDGQRFGMIFYGINRGAAEFWGGGSSRLCVDPPLQRTPVQLASGTWNQCNGTISIDWNAFITTTPGVLGNSFSGGESVYAQAWFRDPPAPKGSTLSDALAYTVCP